MIMGMYDSIKDRVICPYCNKETLVEEQIKWAECECLYFKKGNTILDCLDGFYDWGSEVRNTLEDNCKSCGKLIRFGIVIKNNVWTETKIIRSNNDESY